MSYFYSEPPATLPDAGTRVDTSPTPSTSTRDDARKNTDSSPPASSTTSSPLPSEKQQPIEPDTRGARWLKREEYRRFESAVNILQATRDNYQKYSRELVIEPLYEEDAVKPEQLNRYLKKNKLRRLMCDCPDQSEEAAILHAFAHLYSQHDDVIMTRMQWFAQKFPGVLD